MKILWLSRHAPMLIQIEELRRLFGADMQLQHDKDSFATADVIVQRLRRSESGEVVVVAPLSVIAALIQRGVKPLWAQMEEVTASDPRAMVTARGTTYRFIEFRRVLAVELVTEPIQPPE